MLEDPLEGLRDFLRPHLAVYQIIVTDACSEHFNMNVTEIKQWMDNEDAYVYLVTLDELRGAFIILKADIFFS
uniref:Uncharacterized protein n=1 Tax=Tetranychus urticae TaxID=32264 RepID=T1JTH4_TETUR